MIALGLGFGLFALLSLAASFGFCTAAALTASKVHDNEAAYFLLAHAARGLLSTADLEDEGDMLPIPRTKVNALLQVLAEADALTGIASDPVA